MIIAKRLVFIYFLLSLLSFVAVLVIALIAPKQVNSEATVHTFIIAVMSLLLYLFAHRAAGNKEALLRVRIVIGVLLVALVLTAFILSIPLWLRIEHLFAVILLAWAGYVTMRREVRS